MPDWVVRQNCEYSISVEAETEKEAMEKADKVDLAEWSKAWSGLEADED